MRKLLLGTAAVALAASFVASPANAQVSLDVSGHFKGYMTWLDQDEGSDDVNTVAVEADRDVRSFDIQRDTEMHFSGETTLDNGLTVGFHTEAHIDATDAAATGISGVGTAGAGGDGFNVEESYAYFSGAWGRVNFGAEDGSTYLLQVAAPSADSNIDGLRQYVNPINNVALSATGLNAGAFDAISISDIFAGTLGGAASVILDTGAAGAGAGDIIAGTAITVVGAVSRRLDYDHAISGYENKLTYMTPVFNGFQGGISYTPELNSNVGNGVNEGVVGVGAGNNLDDTISEYGEVWEIAARYEGQFDEVGVTLGGGWSHAELEEKITSTAGGAEVVFFRESGGAAGFDAADTITATQGDREAWNVGIDFDWKAFGLGGGYTEDDNGVSGDELETETWFVGLDYTTGPFKLGASYISQDQNFGGAELETDRWTGGVVYTYGPGMTFRGSISFSDFDENLGAFAAGSNASSDADATSLLLGTQINF